MWPDANEARDLLDRAASDPTVADQLWRRYRPALRRLVGLRLAPIIAVVNGTMFLIKGGILSGGFYLQAAVTFLAIFPMVAFSRFAPIIFGAVAAACFFATGLKYQLRRMRAR